MMCIAGGAVRCRRTGCGNDLYPDGESQPQRAAMDQRQPAGQRQDRIGYIIYSAIELPDAWAPETPKRNLVLATFSKCATYTTATPHTAGPISSTWAPRPASLPRPTAPRAWRAGRGGQQCALWAEGVLIDTWCQDGWAAGYLVPYDRFFEAARWQPLSFVGLLLLCVVGSIVLYRRHRNLVVRRPRPVTNGWSKANPSTAP